MVDLRKLDLARANLDHEKSRIRSVRIGDLDEKKRLWEIDADTSVAKFVENVSATEEELVEFANLGKNYLVLAVEGKVGHVDEEEIGKLQGWISVYHDDKRRLMRLRRHQLADLLKDGLRVLEIGFARHPRAKSGQMASAVRQTLRLLHEEHKKDGEHELVVTAYADEDNEASMRVLEAAGFVRKGRVKYHVKNVSHDYLFVWRE